MEDCPTAPPELDALVDDLKLLREKGLSRLEQLDLTALTLAGRIAVTDADSGTTVAEVVLRRAVDRFGGGRYGEAAAVLFGLDQGTRTSSSRVRRELAAECIERSADTFRRRYETTMLVEIAKQILTLCAEQSRREATLNRATRHPAESAMAVEWLRRFESYYRIWTPIYSLGADLTAYRATLFENERPYDRRFGSTGPTDIGYSQEEQAEGYGDAALYHYARFSWELRQFVTRSGGLWLLSDATTEQAVADSVMQISWHTPWNERDESLLRTIIAGIPDHELHGFLSAMGQSDLSHTTREEWQEWLGTCACQWEPAASPASEYFPTASQNKDIAPECGLHQVVAACNAYCTLIDEDWRKVADWYHLDEDPHPGSSAEQLYVRHAHKQRRVDHDHPTR